MDNKYGYKLCWIINILCGNIKMNIKILYRKVKCLIVKLILI